MTAEKKGIRLTFKEGLFVSKFHSCPSHHLKLLYHLG
uniref:Uncharacterized protein n=1 Tax=Vitis vinifera TaxID=29760 RepID=F6HL58_VITVI